MNNILFIPRKTSSLVCVWRPAATPAMPPVCVWATTDAIPALVDEGGLQLCA